jgi:VanZ family protein
LIKQFSNTLNTIIFYRLPVIALSCFIFWQSSYPGIISQPLFPYNDKVMHFGAYAMIAFFAARALNKDKPLWSPIKIKILAIGFTCLFGLSDEIHQSFVPLRDASFWDFFADCAGSIAGSFFYMAFIHKRYRQSSMDTIDNKT